MASPSVYVAGRAVSDPVRKLVDYAGRYAKTLREYDLVGPGAPDRLTRHEVTRTRVIASRVSERQADWFVERAASAPWSAVEPGLSLADLDPVDNVAAYRAATALYEHFLRPAPSGVAVAKVSKVLHVKRPELVPILDRRLTRVYRRQAAAAAGRYSALSAGRRFLFWLAVREDVVLPVNVEAFAQLHDALRSHSDEAAQQVAELSDLRLLDILTWASPDLFAVRSGHTMTPRRRLGERICG